MLSANALNVFLITFVINYFCLTETIINSFLLSNSVINNFQLAFYKICEGVISRITPPLIWVELAADLIRVLPFTSTELFPSGWCTENNIDVTQLLAYDGTEEKEAEEGESTTDKVFAYELLQ